MGELSSYISTLAAREWNFHDSGALVDTGSVMGLRRPLRTLRSQVQLLVGSLLLLLLVSATGTLLVQRQVHATQVRLRHTFRPAQVAVAMLGEAYVSRETAERGYLLTGDASFLQPYKAGEVEAARFRRQLEKDLAGSGPASRNWLARVDRAAAAWDAQVADPEIAARRRGAMTLQALRAHVLSSKNLFDELRASISGLDNHVNQLAAATVAEIDSAQATANSLTVGAGLAALALLFVAALVLRNSLSRPLTELVAQVQRVADGDLGHSVTVSGPEELTTVATAVEAMRVRILAQTARTMEMQRRIDLTEESERIAGGLQDLVVGRLSRTGLILQSVASRHPATAAALSGAVDEMDNAIRELRSVVFGLTARRRSIRLHERVLDLVTESEGKLGFSPRLQLDGTLDERVPPAVVDEVVLVLREFLADIGRHAGASAADVSLTVTGGELCLRVTDNGTDLSAAPDAGETPAEGGGTVVEWSVPLGAAVTSD
ncbi:MAG: CHASE3 domain-containing protein [Micromonosporaceae bacterium]